MMLGDILAAARRSGASIETWLKPADPDLWDALSAQARQQGRPVVEIARTAMDAFSNRADEEDWAMLISKMRDDVDPGRILLLTMIRWQLGAATGGKSFAHREDIE